MKIVYQATDGKLFRSEEECNKYEQMQGITIEQVYNKTFNIDENKMIDAELCDVTCFFVESKLYAIKINNLNELKILNTVLELCDNNALSTDYIGKEIVIEKADWSDDMYVHGTREDMFHAFANFVNSIETLNKSGNTANSEN